MPNASLVVVSTTGDAVCLVFDVASCFRINVAAEYQIVNNRTEQQHRLNLAASCPCSAVRSPAGSRGQFLAFILFYTKLNGRAPAEADIAAYLGLAAPSVHGIVLALEKKEFIDRTPGAARSIRLLVGCDKLPDLE
jgi:hypothetical protein